MLEIEPAGQLLGCTGRYSGFAMLTRQHHLYQEVAKPLDAAVPTKRLSTGDSSGVQSISLAAVMDYAGQRTKGKLRAGVL